MGKGKENGKCKNRNTGRQLYIEPSDDLRHKRRGRLQEGGVPQSHLGETPCIIFCRDLHPDEMFMETALKNNVPLLMTEKRDIVTDNLIAKILCKILL